MTPCEACNEKRIHTPREWAEFHQFAGHGYVAGVGWTLPALEAAAANERAGGRTSADSTEGVQAP